jgi:Uma2 family endonuclease
MTPTLEALSFEKLVDRAEREYFASITPEQIMESTNQATQRKITVESFDVIAKSRPDIQCFNELVIMYNTTKSRVTPDNMIIVHPIPIVDRKSLQLTPGSPRPFMTLEYASESNKRKDYEVNFDKYAHDLQVPYYLIFDADEQKLDVYHLEENGYEELKENAAGRFEIPELELEAALKDGWVRFWHRGKLTDLPGEFVDKLTVAQQKISDAERKVSDAERKVSDAERKASDLQLLADAEKAARLAADAARSTAEAEMARMRDELAQLRNQHP